MGLKLRTSENSNFYKLGEVGQSPVRVSLSPLASLCAASLCAEAGKYHLFGLARVYIPQGIKRANSVNCIKLAPRAAQTELETTTRSD